ncbi:MAG: hypothetical protein HYW05_04920 [Candidatus Diapherotrites archaeon]|nr:hypothetical protein [Candidatus Diapherotrites archaeon]
MRKLNSKGQAAITDALFFLLIVSALATLLFLFINQYGIMVSDEVKRSYGTDYASSALKTILYGSVPRNAGEKLADAETQEIDYLLAAIKEDYAYAKDDGKQRLSPEMQKTLHSNISAIMKPLSEQFDYLFYVYRIDSPSDADEFAYLLLHISGCKAEISSSEFCPEGEGIHADYLCNPKTLSGQSAVSSTLDALTMLIPNSAQSVSSILLSKVADSASSPKTVPARAAIMLWPAVYLKQNETGDFASAPWNCCDASKTYCPAG